jgi:hypothetical protein
MTSAVATVSSVTTARPRRLKRRHLWLVPGLAIAVVANGQAALYGVSIAYLLIFGILPHVPALFPTGRRMFNILHHPLPSLAVVAVAWVGLLPPVALIGSLAWLSHIVVDWALGDGMRHADGSRRGWPW